MEIKANLKPTLWGAVGGAAALAIIGFSWGGWVTEGSASKSAQMRADAAIVSVLAPICVEQFQQSPDPTDLLDQLVKVSSWERRSFVEDRGWATMPGSERPISGVANACAELLGKLKTS